MRIPVLSIVFLFVISFLTDLYIASDVRSMFGKRSGKLYWASAALCWIFLIVTISLPRREADSGIMAVMWMLFIYLTIYAGKFIYLVWSVVGRFFRLIFNFKRKVYPFRWCGLFCALCLIAIMWVGAAYTRHHLMIAEEEIYSPKLPESFDGYKIVQLSDLHVGTWGEDTSFLKQLVDTVNSLNPDLIVFTGDIVNRQTDELAPFIDVLSGLRAKDGVYSILGNHDYGDYVNWPSPSDREVNNRRLADFEKKMGWRLLNNESDYLRNGSDSVLLIGVENWGDPPFPVYGNLDKAVSASNLNDRQYKILLSHNPEHWNREISKNTNIDLTLSGHTHAMQMMLKLGNWVWSPAKYRYEQWGGHFIRENNNGEKTNLYVNTGTGAVGMPARLMSAYPEVTLLTLRRGDVK
ncbi:MAG: metallophosphoesterase [Muribaculaceae bacterium]|nr:metallophosphoesterase [Muribaculaceae bacterium]